MLFRKKLEKDSIWEKIEAKVHAGDLYENNNKFFGGAMGFSAGLSAGGMTGAAIGGAAGGALGGVGAVVGTPIGYVIGSSIGAMLGIPLGKYAARKLARKEYQVHHQKFSRDLFFSYLVLPDIIQELNRIQKLVEFLCDQGIIKSRKEFFFDQLDDSMCTPTQKKLYNMLVDLVMTRVYYTTNHARLIKWKDRKKSFFYLDGIKQELSRLEVELIKVTLIYMNEKKAAFLSKNKPSSHALSKIQYSKDEYETREAINNVVYHLLEAEKDSDCDAIIEKDLKKLFLTVEMFSRFQMKDLMERKSGPS